MTREQDTRGADVGHYYDRLKDATIMMVDDEPILMEVIQAYLEDAGYQNFICVEDSRKAIETLDDKRPDVLLLDLMMPDVDGFRILHALRADDAHRYLPVIVLTSSTDSATKLRALELGATDFLAKPVDPSELALRVRNTLTVKAYQDELAYYDALTGLPNRRLFLDRLAWAIRRKQRDGGAIGVMTIGLDRFKQINETLGPRVGDQILQQVADRLRNSVRQDDVVSAVSDAASRHVARLGGDEFSVLLPDIKRAESAAFIARRILESMHEPLIGDGREVFLSASVGIATYPEDGRDIDALMRNVAVATEHAKQHGRDSFQFYSRDVDAQSRNLFRLETDLRRALEKDEFELHYQPKIDTATGRPVGMEGLLRWHHPELGLVSPITFIPLAEETGMIVSVGEWLLGEACRQNKRLEGMGFDDLKVSVNISAIQIGDENLCNAIVSALESSGLDPSKLIVEITESVMMGDVEEHLAVLNRIRDIGASLSIDDFGTGYSSLAYLKKFPISELKIDKSFLDDIPDSEEDAAIVKAVIALGHTLDLTLTAEGVETAAQVDFLREVKCDVIQGYYFSKQLPSGEFEAFLLDTRAEATA